MTRHQDHADQARLLRRVLAAFSIEEQGSADGAIRRREEGAVIASELAAGEPPPRLATTESEDALRRLTE